MTLQDEIKAFNNEAMSNIPQDVLEVMGRAAKELARSGITNQALAKGATLPPFSLPDIHGSTVNSDELLTKGPLVVSFYRGSW